MEKARKVLANNEFYKESVKHHNETATRLTHWGKAETPEEMINIVGDHVVLSNECSISMTHHYYTTEMEKSIAKDFAKAGLGWEMYDGGTIHLFWEGQ